MTGIFLQKSFEEAMESIEQNKANKEKSWYTANNKSKSHKSAQILG